MYERQYEEPSKTHSSIILKIPIIKRFTWSGHKNDPFIWHFKTKIMCWQLTHRTLQLEVNKFWHLENVEEAYLKLLSISYFLTDLQVDLNIMLQATVHLRDGTTKVFSESHSNESGDGTSPCGQSLSVKIQTMQEQVNSFLTELVEQEKSSGTAQNNKITADEGMH